MRVYVKGHCLPADELNTVEADSTTQYTSPIVSEHSLPIVFLEKEDGTVPMEVFASLQQQDDFETVLAGYKAQQKFDEKANLSESRKTKQIANFLSKGFTEVSIGDKLFFAYSLGKEGIHLLGAFTSGRVAHEMNLGVVPVSVYRNKYDFLQQKRNPGPIDHKDLIGNLPEAIEQVLEND